MALTTTAKRALALAADCPVCPSGSGTECPADGQDRLDGLHDARWDTAVPEEPVRRCPDCDGTGISRSFSCTCEGPYPVPGADHHPDCGLEPCPRGCADHMIVESED